MTCLLKDFLNQFAIEPGIMLEKLLDSKEQERDYALELKLKSKPLTVKSFDLNTLLLFWGRIASDTQEEMSQDIIYHALLFQASNINDSNSQVCFSAIELYKLLEHLDDLQVYLQTPIDKIHQTVLIHTHDSHYIYDPIKDPNLLFTEEEYQINPKHINFLINQSILLAYESLQEKFSELLALDSPSISFNKRK